MIGISGCLAGEYCRYDGQTNLVPALQLLVARGQAKTICPEVLGGLSTPREPAEIIGGDGWAVWQNKAKVVTCTGKEVTAAFKSGAKATYQFLRDLGIQAVILKERSPSCGSQAVYDGTFSKQLQVGVGVTTAYLQLQGIAVYSESNYRDLLTALRLTESTIEDFQL